MLQDLGVTKTMYCGDASLVKTDGRTGTAIPLYCRRWTCPECAPVRRRQVQALARSGRATTFITLTAGPKAGVTAADAARTLVAAWRRLRREIVKQKEIHSLAFIAVFEATKKGRPHLHILARLPWVDQAWLSQRMDALAGSPIVDIRRVHNRSQAAAYVAKYLAKAPTRFEGCKRYWRSQDWQQDAIEPDVPVATGTDGWRTEKRSIETLAYELSIEGYQIDMKRQVMTFTWPWPTAPPYKNELLNGHR